MRKALILPAVAVVGGLIGLVVRSRFLVQAFEPGTGLPIGGVPVTYAMWAVALITAAAIIALSLGKHRTFEKAYTSAFGRGTWSRPAVLWRRPVSSWRRAFSTSKPLSAAR